MKLIINTSTLSGTGVTQVAVSFLLECRNFRNEYHVFLSNTVSNEIKNEIFPENFKFYNFNSHPLYGLKGFKIRRKIRRLERAIVADCVFSVFGPSWWTPKSPHLLGYAYPHYVYPNSPFFNKIKFLEKIKIMVLKEIHVFFLKRNGNYYVSETEDVSNEVVKLLGCSKKNVFTATNTCNNFFLEFKAHQKNILPKKMIDEFRFLSLCSFAPHKNLNILNKVIPLLNNKNPNNKIKFVLTVDEDMFEKNFTEEAKCSIINIGRIDVHNCPQLYFECDALFLPTTLECFSANYPEAMKMKIPIITSNLPFATTVCEDSALYFDPYNPEEIESIINDLVENPKLINLLIKNGEKQLKTFLTSKERAEKYLKICNEIIIKNANNV